MIEAFLNEAKNAKYIKLGTGGDWVQKCIDDGKLRLGYYEAIHEDCLAGNYEDLKFLYSKDTSSGAASNHARQVRDFYEAGPETIWVTSHAGRVYWCIAEKEVHFVSNDRDADPEGSRYKKVIGEWHCTSINNKPLDVTLISGNLTRVFGYRGTICGLSDEVFNYLKNRLLGNVPPEVEAADVAIKALTENLKIMIKKLNPKDFELFADLIFSRSGWQRISALGKTQKDIDMKLVEPLSGMQAVVQVKTQTNQKQVATYQEKFKDEAADLIFYVYHKPDEIFKNTDRMKFIGPQQLAEKALKMGLVEWLKDKVS